MILLEFNVKHKALKCEIMNTYKTGIHSKFQVPRYFCCVNDTLIIYNKPAQDVQNVLAEFINTLPQSDIYHKIRAWS